MRINFIKNVSYRNKLLLFVIVLVFLPMLILQGVNLRDATTLVEQNSIQSAQHILSILEAQVDTVFKSVEKQSLAYFYNAELNDLMSFVDENKGRAYYRDIDFIRRVNAMTNSFRNICLSDSAVEAAGMIATDATVYGYSGNPASFDIGREVNLTALSNAFAANGRKPFWDYLADSDHMAYVRGIDNPTTYGHVGFLVFVINNQTVQTILQSWNPQSSSGNIELLADGQAWLSSGSGAALPGSRDTPPIESSAAGYQIAPETDSFLNYTRLQPPGWRLAVLQPYHTVVSGTEQVTARAAVLTALILAASLLFIICLNRDFVNPVQRLAKSMRQFEKTGKYVPIDLDRGDELGYLARTYSSMTSSIDTLIQQVYEEQLASRDAEIQALQSQINPHFLFNTLQSVNMMAQLDGNEPISDCIMALSSLLEAGMGKKEARIPLCKELEYVQNYIFIMRQRSAGRLELRVELGDAELSGLMIPVLLLQPLVENSVVHASPARKSRLRVLVRVRPEGETVRLEICDNGGGIPPEKLTALTKQLTTRALVTSGSRRSIGVENVNKRLVLLYGEESALKIESRYGFYTRVWFRIPRKTPPIPAAGRSNVPRRGSGGGGS